MMKQLLLLAGVLMVISTLARSQSGEFEVASIKPTTLINVGVKSACHGIDSRFALRDLGATVPLGQCIISSGRLSHMIGVAYGVTMDVLDGGPDWVTKGGNRFDLEAKAENPSSVREGDLLMMLQRLLADRFKLKFHWEMREIDGFELLVAKTGRKFQEAKPDEEEKIPLDAFLEIVFASRIGGDNAAATPKQVNLSSQKISMARLAQILGPAAGGHIEDRTNLKGFYDFSLVAEPGEAISAPLEKQLGLRLEHHKIQVRFFIVDSAEKPTAN